MNEINSFFIKTLPPSPLTQTQSPSLTETTTCNFSAPQIPEQLAGTHQKFVNKKFNEHLWKEIFLPQFKVQPNFSNIFAPLMCKVDASGDLIVTLLEQYLNAEIISDLKERLSMNRHIEELDTVAANGVHSYKIKSHHLPYLFFQAQETLNQFAETNLKLKEALDELKTGILPHQLMTVSPEEVEKFKTESIPGDYIVVVVPAELHAFQVVYKNQAGKIHSFTYSSLLGAFSSFEGLTEIRRPFHLRNSKPIEIAKAHNGFIHCKNVAVINSLKKYAGSEINDYAIGGIDQLIGLAEILAWHEFLPCGQLKSDLSSKLLPYYSILLAHFNNLKGKSLDSENPVSLEGMRRPPAKEEISESALRYLEKSHLLTLEHREILFCMLSKAVRFSNKSDKVISNLNGGIGNAETRFHSRNIEILQELDAGIPISISTGWAKHSIEITLIKKEEEAFLLYTNKGATLHPDNDTRLYRVGETITAEMIGHLRRRPYMGSIGEKYGTYYHSPEKILNEVKEEMNGERPQTMEEEFGLGLIAKFSKKSQTAGNCSVANGKEMIYNSSFLLSFVDYLHTSDEQGAAVLASKHAKAVSKEYQLNQRIYQLKVWKHFSNFLGEDPNFLEQHFKLFQMITTKYVNKKEKIDHLIKFGEIHNSLIMRELDELKLAMKEFIKESQCDISLCTCGIPYSKGNRIKNGPKGSFGIYKANKNILTLKNSSAPEYHLVLKDLKGKFNIFDITSAKDGSEKYQISNKQGTFYFTTLGQLATQMENKGHEMVFAL